MNETVTLPKSGHVLHLQMASFELAGNLRRIFAAELSSTTINLPKGSAGMTMEQFMESDIDTSSFIKLFLTVLASKRIEDAVMECAKPCMLEFDGVKQKITSGLFEAKELRGDYLPVLKEVALYNISPFFESLDLSSLLASSQPGTSLK